MGPAENIADYYKKRAQEYEKIYFKPERQSALKETSHFLQNIFAGKNVLEVACGTGYWTERIAASCEKIHATDINNEVLEIARQKQYPRNNASFSQENLFDPDDRVIYDNLFAGFIWSHIPIADLLRFITVIRNRVQPFGQLVFMDNKYVEGSNLPVTETDAEGNTYQTRTLSDGSVHRVLKNFPDEHFLKDHLLKVGEDFWYRDFQYFWICGVKAKGN